MSFLTVLTQIGGYALKAATISEPFVAAVNPLAGRILGITVKAIADAELSGATGAEKKSTAQIQIEGVLLQEVNDRLIAQGQPTITIEKLSGVLQLSGLSVDALVLASNSVAKITAAVEALTGVAPAK